MAKWEQAPLVEDEESAAKPRWASAPLVEDGPPVANPGNTKPEVSRIPEAAGPGEAVLRGLMPRSFKAAEQDAGLLRLGTAGALDALSAPGRIAGSLNAPDSNSKMMSVGLGGAMIPVQPDAVKGHAMTQEDRGQLENMADTQGQNFGQKLIRDPALLPSLATGGLAGAGMKGLGLAGLKASVGAGAALGAESAAIHQADNAVQGKKIDPLSAGGEVLTGAALPVGAAAVGAGAKFANKVLGKVAEQLTGVSEDALRMHGMGLGQGAKDLTAAAGQQHEIGKDLVNMLDNLDEYLPEKEIVNRALAEMPPVDASKAIATLEAAKTPGRLASGRAANSKIDEVINDIRGAANKEGFIPAAEFRGFRQDLDAEIGDAFGKESSKYIGALKQARYQMADDLVDAAAASGKPEYVEAMKSMAAKLRTADRLSDFLGKSASTRETRAESFVSNLFGKNKSERQAAVGMMDELFGSNLLERTKMASMAAELGPEGKAALMPRQWTGRSLLAPLIGGGLGYSIDGERGAGIGVMLGSPRLASAALSGSGAAARGLSQEGLQIGASKLAQIGLRPLFRGEGRNP